MQEHCHKQMVAWSEDWKLLNRTCPHPLWARNCAEWLFAMHNLGYWRRRSGICAKMMACTEQRRNGHHSANHLRCYLGTLCEEASFFVVEWWWSVYFHSSSDSLQWQARTGNEQQDLFAWLSRARIWIHESRWPGIRMLQHRFYSGSIGNPRHFQVACGAVPFRSSLLWISNKWQF